MDQHNVPVPEMITRHTISFASAISLATTLVTLFTFILAVLTPPLGGPYCTSGCFEYPYHDIASRWPRDYFWMFPAMLIPVLTVLLLACIHHHSTGGARLYSMAGAMFMIISATLLIMDYFVQTAVIQPSLLQGEYDGIALLSQFNPHGIFIALEEIGLIMASFALFCTIPAFPARSARTIRWVFGFAFFMVVVAIAGHAVVYGLQREYRLEVALITIVWLELIIGGIVLYRYFRQMPHLRVRSQ